MLCQLRIHWATLALVFHLGVIVNVHAHSSRTDFDIQAGTGGFAEFGIVGRFGFTPFSPWYWLWDLKRISVGNHPITTGAMRVGTEIGREDRRVSWGIRAQGIGHSIGPTAEDWTGASLRLRLIPWDELVSRERSDLQHDEREVRAWQRDLVAQAAVPTAPIVSIDFDKRNVVSKFGGDTKFGNTVGQIAVLYQIRPFWFIVPNVQFISTIGDENTFAQGLILLPSNRLIRWGPQGLLSGISGSPIRSNQILNYLNFSDRLGFQIGFQWVEMRRPAGQLGSIWLGAERKFGLTQEWSVLAGTEWIGIGAPATGQMSIRIRYQGQDRYIPRK